MMEFQLSIFFFAHVLSVIDPTASRSITEKEDVKCLCVPFYQCDTSGHIITDGSGIIDARINKPDSTRVDPNCESHFHACCIPSKYVKNNSPPSTDAPTTNKPRLCGTRKSNAVSIDGRILDPGTTRFGDFPWQVAILRLSNGKKLFTGAGVLIDEKHIVTVAHKVYNVVQQNLLIRIGAWNLSTDEQPWSYQEFKVSDVVWHPNFNNVSLKNDIALLVLDGLVSYSSHVQSICLPKIDENHDGRRCLVTGWGKDSFGMLNVPAVIEGEGKHSDVLKQVSVPMVNFEQCQNDLRKTRLGSFFVLDPSFICAGGEKGLDSCLGDGGGPLACQRGDGSFALMGLVAWGIGCGNEGVPGVYVHVSHFLDWILSLTGK